MTAAGNASGFDRSVLEQPEVAISHRTIGIDFGGEKDNPVVEPFQVYGHLTFLSNLSQEVLDTFFKPRTFSPEGIGQTMKYL